MHKYLISLCLLTGLCFGQIMLNEPDRRSTLPEIIQRYKKDNDSVYNHPKINNEAKLFFIYAPSHLNNKEDFKNEINFLAPVYKQISKAGVELIIIDYKDEESLKKKARSFRKLCRSSKLKCPFVNSFNKEIRAAVSQGYKGSQPSYTTPNLRAVDQYGTPVAFFVETYRSTGQVIIMEKCQGRRVSKVICENPKSDREWITLAIADYYEELLALALSRDANGEPK